MKNIVTMIVTAILGAVTLAVVLSVSGRMNRSVELDSSLPSVIEGTVKSMADAGNYGINNVDECLADMLESLCVGLDADSDISVRVPVIDLETKILSARVIGNYVHPNGKAGTVECERNVILNQIEEEEPASNFVRFYLSLSDLTEGKGCYKEYSILKGDMITVPLEPSADGKVFAGWKDVNGVVADLSQTVTQDVNYYADWR